MSQTFDVHARRTLWESGVPIASFIASFALDGWRGDVCGCSDDRCIGYHHGDDEDCACLPVLIEQYIQNGGPTR